MKAKRANRERAGTTSGLYDLAEPKCGGGSRTHRQYFNWSANVKTIIRKRQMKETVNRLASSLTLAR
jgi:hypothetical protein